MNKKYIEIKQIKWGSVLLLIALSIMIIYIIISAYFREDHTFLMLYSIVIFIGLLCLILVGSKDTEYFTKIKKQEIKEVK